MLYGFYPLFYGMVNISFRIERILYGVEDILDGIGGVRDCGREFKLQNIVALSDRWVYY
jgi:hypothetical protein